MQESILNQTGPTAAMNVAVLALRLVEATLPHLSGLSRQVRMVETDRVSVAAVAASGLTLINPAVFCRLTVPDAMYIIAHELMHLALDTHARAGEADRLTVNIAHDYIINDMLSDELHRIPPLGGLYEVGASEQSLEDWIVQLRQSGTEGLNCWRDDLLMTQTKSPRSALSRALLEAGLVSPEEADPTITTIHSTWLGDLLSGEEEHEFEPEITSAQRETLTKQTRSVAVRAASLIELRDRMDRAAVFSGYWETEPTSQCVTALQDAYNTPWERVLQQWVDSVAPGQRDYSRASRRAGQRSDVVLPGRSRHGWTMHIVLDSSGSMADVLPHALGAISSFCQASGVGEVHIVQCDCNVTSDRWIEVGELASLEVSGYGGSDMSSAMNKLASDPNVTAALIITDGYIRYPEASPSYEVMWAVLGDHGNSFHPRYGLVARICTKEW